MFLETNASFKVGPLGMQLSQIFHMIGMDGIYYFCIVHFSDLEEEIIFHSSISMMASSRIWPHRMTMLLSQCRWAFYLPWHFGA